MGTDEVVRKGVEGLEAWDFGTTVAAVAPPLAEARVAIVTTAGLRSDGSRLWADGQGFVAHPCGARDLTLAHVSPNFDTMLSGPNFSNSALESQATGYSVCAVR